jgi:ADP-ribose pyrophosphatase YjhB (NUDIX family)
MTGATTHPLDADRGALPHQTVAVVAKRGDRYLMVEEFAEGRAVFNQPAGHVECDETVMQAAVRETVEETAWQVSLKSLIGIYHYTAPANGVRYVRVCFAAHPEHEVDSALDPAIKAAHWLSLEQLRALPLRSPLVLKVIEDFERGASYPLTLFAREAVDD